MLTINAVILQTCLGQYPQLKNQIAAGPHHGRHDIDGQQNVDDNFV